MLLGSLLVLLVLVCIALGAVILLQRSEGGALGMGGGPSGFMTARGAGDLLTRTTAILAAIFFGLCLLLTVLSGRMHAGGSVVDRLKVDSMNPNDLNRAMRPSGPVSTTAPAPAAAGGSAANIGVVTPAPGAPAAEASPPGASFEAPRPEVHTAPAVKPTTPPTAADSGANRRSSSLLGVQTAPQSTPTVAPLAHPFPAGGGGFNAPAPAAASPAAAGNTSGGL